MKVILTGSTGMIGKGILLECLEDTQVKEVLVINRSSLKLSNSKLTEIIHEDFADISTLRNRLKGYDACFFAMGVSAVGKSEEEYNHLTFNIATHWADVLFQNNPKMTFNYVSGQGTDNSEKGSSMWAKVKGKTENYILNKGFKSATMFRPGIIIPEKGIKSRTSWYSYIYMILTPFFPLLKKLDSITTTTKIGKAMINSVLKEPTDRHLENAAINQLSQKQL